MPNLNVSVLQMLDAAASNDEPVYSILTYSKWQADALVDILKERDYQDQLWGPAFDRNMTNGQWLDTIRDYAYGHGRALGYDFRKRMMKVAAIALAAVENEDAKDRR